MLHNKNEEKLWYPAMKAMASVSRKSTAKHKNIWLDARENSSAYYILPNGGGNQRVDDRGDVLEEIDREVYN